MLYQLARPALFALSGEQAHDLTLAALRRGAGRLYPARVPARPVRVMGLDFPNPVGLAAGLDKNGDCIDGLAALGVEHEVYEDGIRIVGGPFGGGEVDSHGDHRIAMSFAMAALRLSLIHI